MAIMYYKLTTGSLVTSNFFIQLISKLELYFVLILACPNLSEQSSCLYWIKYCFSFVFLLVQIEIVIDFFVFFFCLKYVLVIFSVFISIKIVFSTL